MVLIKLKFHDHEWSVCYRSKIDHRIKTDSPERKDLLAGRENLIGAQLLHRGKQILPFVTYQVRVYIREIF